MGERCLPKFRAVPFAPDCSLNQGTRQIAAGLVFPAEHPLAAAVERAAEMACVYYASTGYALPANGEYRHLLCLDSADHLAL